MICFLLLLCFFCVYKISFSDFHRDYMDVAQTTSIKGIFITIVLLSHANSYLKIEGSFGDEIYMMFFNILGQLMVTLFLFYSGYGVMESYKNKDCYEKNFLKNRFSKTLMHFDIALVLFVLINLFLGSEYSWSNYLFCWIGWKSIGNSNWFMFVVLLLYLITYIVFNIDKYILKEKKSIWKIMAVLSLVVWIFLYFVKPSYWYNTLFCYVVGMMYSTYKVKIDEELMKPFIYTITFLILSITFMFLYLSGDVIDYSLCACVFSLLVVLFTMKVKVDNSILRFMGNYLFPIYILQRIPMIVMDKIGLKNPIIFTAVAIVITIPLAVIFDRCMKQIDKKVFEGM